MDHINIGDSLGGTYCRCGWGIVVWGSTEAPKDQTLLWNHIQWSGAQSDDKYMYLGVGIG